MANHAATRQVRALMDLGITEQQIRDRIGRGCILIWNEEDGVHAEALGRSSLMDLDDFLAEVESAPPPVNTPAAVVAAAEQIVARAAVDTLATPRQVATILRLLARRRRSGEGGGFSGLVAGLSDRASVARLTRAQASEVIDSLTSDY